MCALKNGGHPNILAYSYALELQFSILVAAGKIYRIDAIAKKSVILV